MASCCGVGWPRPPAPADGAAVVPAAGCFGKPDLRKESAPGLGPKSQSSPESVGLSYLYSYCRLIRPIMRGKSSAFGCTLSEGRIKTYQRLRVAAIRDSEISPGPPSAGSYGTPGNCGEQPKLSHRAKSGCRSAAARAVSQHACPDQLDAELNSARGTLPGVQPRHSAATQNHSAAYQVMRAVYCRTRAPCAEFRRLMMPSVLGVPRPG